jgi:NitT/TauT family transport system ATP-binding protein
MAVTEVPRRTADALAFQDVSMVFSNGTHALQSVSFQVNWGEFVAIVGPSGCGKSTLLRIASGLETAIAGKVRVGGTNLGLRFPRR